MDTPRSFCHYTLAWDKPHTTRLSMFNIEGMMLVGRRCTLAMHMIRQIRLSLALALGEVRRGEVGGGAPATILSVTEALTHQGVALP